MKEIVPTGLQGRLTLPPSKSHTLRACLFASLADGTSYIENILDSPDTEAMIEACQALGATIIRNGSSLTIHAGVSQKDVHIHARQSGLVLRLMAAVFATTSRKSVLEGDPRRPCQALISALCQMGAKIESVDGHAPLTIQGPIKPTKISMDGKDSQPVSAILIAASLLDGTTEIEVQNSGEKPWLQVTLDWLKRLGISYTQVNDCYKIEGRAKILPFTYKVPADLSALAFMLAIGLLTESELVIEDVDLCDVQGDKEIIPILERMGARFTIQDHSIKVCGPQKLQGASIDVNGCIDALPILSVIGCFASGTTHLYNGRVAREKESDRIHCMKCELEKMGADITETSDALIIRQSRLQGAIVDSHNDHRVAMSLAVAALAAETKTHLTGEGAVEKTYKNFFKELERLYDKTSSCRL